MTISAQLWLLTRQAMMMMMMMMGVVGLLIQVMVVSLIMSHGNV